MTNLEDEDLVLKAQAPDPVDPAIGPDLVPASDVAVALPQVPRDPAPEPGDPPPAVRGAAQELADPPGDAADDGEKRWDPRTLYAREREGG